MRTLSVLLTAILLMGSATAPVSLVQNEYDFAAAVAQKGLRDGFLMYLDKQAITLNPKPVNDYDENEKAKPSGANPNTKLTWYPAWALVSASGDFGVDTGPWTYEAVGKEGKAQKAYGDWFTVWARGKDGPWKALFDSGIDHTQPGTEKALAHDAAVPQLTALQGPLPATTVLHDQLAQAEAAFADEAAVKGLRGAYQKMGAEELRLMQEDHAPVLGKPAVLQASPTQPSGLAWAPIGGSVARSGDLGYVYGMTYTAADAKQQKPLDSFMHVWQRGADGWKLLVALYTPIPQGK